jgi:hypothetical protein
MGRKGLVVDSLADSHGNCDSGNEVGRLAGSRDGTQEVVEAVEDLDMIARLAPSKRIGDALAVVGRTHLVCHIPHRLQRLETDVY